jgi:hypothetical protein
MDVDTVERSSRSIIALQTSVDSLLLSIDRIMAEIQGAWSGQDSQEFVQSRWPGYRTDIRAIGESLRSFGELALRNASDQRGVSDTLGGGGGDAGHVGGRAVEETRIDTDGDGSYDSVVFIEGGSTITHEWPDGYFTDARYIESAFSGGRGDHDATSGLREDGSYAANAFAEGSYGVEAVNERHAQWGDVSLDSRAEMFAGARGEARAEVEIGPDGASGRLGAGGFAGSEVTGSGSIGTDVLGAGLDVSARAGFGADAQADFDVDYDQVTIGFKIGASVGIGAAIKPSISFSPRAIVEYLRKL